MNQLDIVQEWDGLSQIISDRLKDQPYLSTIKETETLELTATIHSLENAFAQNELNTGQIILQNLQNQIENFQPFNPSMILWAYKDQSQTIFLTLKNKTCQMRITPKQGASSLGKTLRAAKFLLKTENHFFNPNEIIGYSQKSSGEFRQTKVIQIHFNNGQTSENITGPESKQIISILKLAKIPELSL